MIIICFCQEFFRYLYVDKEKDMKSKITKKGNRYYFDDCWYMVEDGNGEYNVYNDGEYEGKYCGSLERLYDMVDPLGYVMMGL